VRSIGPSSYEFVKKRPVVVQDFEVVTFRFLEHQVLTLNIQKRKIWDEFKNAKIISAKIGGL
jgi:hypothetical protein